MESRSEELQDTTKFLKIQALSAAIEAHQRTLREIYSTRATSSPDELIKKAWTLKAIYRRFNVIFKQYNRLNLSESDKILALDKGVDVRFLDELGKRSALFNIYTLRAISQLKDTGHSKILSFYSSLEEEWRQKFDQLVKLSEGDGPAFTGEYLSDYNSLCDQFKQISFTSSELFELKEKMLEMMSSRDPEKRKLYLTYDMIFKYLLLTSTAEKATADMLKSYLDSIKALSPKPDTSLKINAIVRYAEDLCSEANENKTLDDEDREAIYSELQKCKLLLHGDGYVAAMQLPIIQDVTLEKMIFNDFLELLSVSKDDLSRCLDSGSALFRVQALIEGFESREYPTAELDSAVSPSIVSTPNPFSLDKRCASVPDGFGAYEHIGSEKVYSMSSRGYKGTGRRQEDALAWQRYTHDEIKDLSPEEIGRRLWTAYHVLHQSIATRPELEVMGTTACTTIIKGRDLITATVGDSVVFVALYKKDGTFLGVERLNRRLHHVSDQIDDVSSNTEASRIPTVSGSQVRDGYVIGPNVKRGSGCANTRAIGDIDHAPAVIADADIAINNLDALAKKMGCDVGDLGDVKIITTCDGFTEPADVQSKYWHKKYLEKCLSALPKDKQNDPSQLAEECVKYALKDGTKDNASVAVQIIKPDEEFNGMMGLYDGHGGSDVSHLVAENVIPVLNDILRLSPEDYAVHQWSVFRNRKVYTRDNGELSDLDPATKEQLDLCRQLIDVTNSHLALINQMDPIYKIVKDKPTALEGFDLASKIDEFERLYAVWVESKSALMAVANTIKPESVSADTKDFVLLLKCLVRAAYPASVDIDKVILNYKQCLRYETRGMIPKSIEQMRKALPAVKDESAPLVSDESSREGLSPPVVVLDVKPELSVSDESKPAVVADVKPAPLVKTPENTCWSMMLAFMAEKPATTGVCVVLILAGVATALLAFGAMSGGVGFDAFIAVAAKLIQSSASVVSVSLGSVGVATSAVSTAALSYGIFAKSKNEEAVKTPETKPGGPASSK